LPAINLTIDPTEIFDTGLLPHSNQVNDRYRKFDYLLKHCGDCTGFLLGSSRMGYTDPALFNEFLSRGRCYNMNISSANAWDYLEFARYLRRKGIKPELLVVQLDVYHLFGHRVRYEHHPDFSGESRFRFYFENLFSLPYQSVLGKLRNNLRGKAPNEFDWETGQRSKPDAERRLQQDPDAYVRDQPEFRPVTGRPLVGSDQFRRATDQTVEAMRELRRLTEADDVRLIIFVTPHNQHYLDRYRGDDIEYFLAKLAGVTPFWNFASYSSVTTDDRNYYEAQHHRPRVAEMVAARISGRESAGIPDDFGRWVSRETLDAVLRELQSQFEARRRAGLRSE
jgi:hypothetical protein